MKTLMAGPDGTRYPDKVYQVPTQEGRDLIAGGYAEEVKGDANAAAPRAAARPQGRTATKPEAKVADGDAAAAGGDDAAADGDAAAADGDAADQESQA